MNSLSTPKILVCGQLITSRTETLEEYLRERVNTLAVIGITSAFALRSVSRCIVYTKGELTQKFKLPSFQIRNMKWYKQPLLCISFSVYLFSILYAIVRLREKFDLFIGISCFSALTGVFLKRLNVVRNSIYYSIDYYPHPSRISFNALVVWAFRVADMLCVRNVDLTWHISPRIPEARHKYARVRPDSHKHLVAPLTYGRRFLRFRPVEEIERHTIGFVGTLSENQGLQLLVRAMPKIIREIPRVKVRIIGKGPYENELKRLVVERNLSDYFVFYGFIEDDGEVLDILSSCALGVAPWTSGETDNATYADPGKPKLYAFCGLPTIITNGTLVAYEIGEWEAGISINYDENELANATVRLLKDENRLKEYKKNASDFAKGYTTEKIFDAVLQESFLCLK